MNVSWYTWNGDQLTLNIHLQPGARKDECCTLFNNRLRIKTRAPAVAGKANKGLARFLATEFNTSVTNVKITHGLTSRTKTVQIQSPKDLPDWYLLLTNNTINGDQRQ